MVANQELFSLSHCIESIVVDDVPSRGTLDGGGSLGRGSLEDVANFGWNDDCGLLVNSSRGIIYASQEEDFAEKAGLAAKQLQAEMERILAEKHF